uniref:Uncharacterized protein n=1 Tax=Leersia perrieri TaxID=77586 RepID=A0A0D9VDX2_9ORYZ
MSGSPEQTHTGFSISIAERKIASSKPAESKLQISPKTLVPSYIHRKPPPATGGRRLRRFLTFLPSILPVLSRDIRTAQSLL